MGRILVAVDPMVGVSTEDALSEWDDVIAGDLDLEMDPLTKIRTEPLPGTTFLPGVVELLVLPLAVNIASSVLYDAVKRLITGAKRDTVELEIAETTTPSGDRLVVVRVARDRS